MEEGEEGREEGEEGEVEEGAGGGRGEGEKRGNFCAREARAAPEGRRGGGSGKVREREGERPTPVHPLIDTDSSRSPGITSGLYGPMNVHRGAVISAIVAVNLFFCILHLNATLHKK